MSPTSDTDRDQEVEALRAENEVLRRELAVAAGRTEGRGRRRARAALAGVSITIGAILAPVALTAAWAATEVSDTERFVASLSPLSHDPAVRAFLGTAIVSQVETSVDIDGFTADALGDLAGLGLAPRAATALRALAPAAADGIRQLLDTVVHKAIDSPAFQKVFDTALRLSHDQLVSVLEGDPDGAVVVSGSGSVGIRLAPMIGQVKAVLHKADFPLADQIPVVDTTIAVGTIKNIAQLRAGYRLLVGLSAALPWVSLAFLVLGVLVARGRTRATAAAGFAVAGAATLLLIALVTAAALLPAAAGTRAAPEGVVFSLFGALTAQLRAASLSVALIGITVAAIGFLSGRSEQAAAVRLVWARGTGAAHRLLDTHGFSNPRLGATLHNARFAVWTVLALAALVVLIVSRPLTPGVVVVTALVVAVVAMLHALLRRDATETAAEASGD